MIIAVLNRGGHQWGWRNRHPKSWNATGLFSTHSDGDILKACWTGSGWIIESTTDGTTICHQNEREPNLNSSAMEFYFGDYAEGEGARGKVHWEASQGALAFNRVEDEILLVAMNPVVTFSGGITWLDPYPGNHTGGVTIYDNYRNDDQADTFGKAEMMCQEIPIELGNRVWHDVNEDGIQDADEPGIPDVEITMYDDDDASSATFYTAVTDEFRFYAFNTGNVPPGIKYFAPYHFEINAAPPALIGHNALATKNSLVDPQAVDPGAVDSDADFVGGKGEIFFTTGGTGASVRTYDFGWY